MKDSKSNELELKVEKLLDNGGKLKNDNKLIEEIVSHLNKIGLEFIFVNDKPLTEYGENCYKVYFKNDNYFAIEDWTGGDSASMICYFKNNKPILSL